MNFQKSNSPSWIRQHASRWGLSFFLAITAIFLVYFNPRSAVPVGEVQVSSPSTTINSDYTVSGDETWTTAGSPYIILGNLTIR